MRATTVIATHERWSSLLRLLGSLDSRDREVIVVDDGSKQPPPLELRRRFPRVRLLSNPHGGRCVARNSGARAAQGELVLFLDDDMEVGPGFIEGHEAYHAAADRMITGAVRLPGAFAETPFGRFRLWLEGMYEPAGRRTADGLCEIDGTTAQNMSLRRETFLRLGGFDERLRSAGCEDYDLFLRARNNGTRPAYAPDLRAIHHDSFADLRRYAARERTHAGGWVELIATRPAVLAESPRFVDFCRRCEPALAARSSLARAAWVAGWSLAARAGARDSLCTLAERLERLGAPDALLRKVYFRVLVLEELVGYREAVDRLLGGRPPVVLSTRAA